MDAIIRVAPEVPVPTLQEARVQRNCNPVVTIAKVVSIASIIFSLPLYVFGALKSDNDAVAGGLLISAACIVNIESFIALTYLSKAS